MPKEEDQIRSLDGTSVIPASITVIPDLYLQASGSVAVSAGEDSSVSASASYDLLTSWRILGSFEVDLGTSWNTGGGVWYWYRVEGECGPVECETFGVESGSCNRMTFVTTVSARSISELCETLSSPNVNAPARIRALSIRRYSRPVFKDQIQPDQCNVLEEMEFCQIPECLDYCPEESAPLMKFSNLVLPEPSDFELAVVAKGRGLLSASSDPSVLVASASVGASVSGLGYEQDDTAVVYDMEAPSETVSACGCEGAGLSLNLRHTLGRSSALSRFLKSNGLSLGDRAELRYRSFDTSWTSSTHLINPAGGWTISFEMACRDGLWRFSLSAKDGRKQTRLTVDLPPEIVCPTGRMSMPMKVYFNSRKSSAERGVQVVTPARTQRFAAEFASEVFVDGIFVPTVVYYDELGLFVDSFWDYSPLSININPTSKNPTTVMSLAGIV